MSIFDKIINISEASAKLVSRDSEKLGEKVFFLKFSYDKYMELKALQRRASMRIMALATGSDVAEDKEADDFPYRVICESWCEKDGSKIIDSDERKKTLRSMDKTIIIELAQLACEANGMTPTKSVDLEKKKTK